MTVFIGANTALAQKKIDAINKPGYDDKLVHYGFYLAVPFTKYNVTHSQEYVNQLENRSSPVTVNAKVSPGFYTGLVLNVRLAEYLDARFVPGVGFYARRIEYGNDRQRDGTMMDMDHTISSTTVELPLLLKYKSKRRTNFRVYFVGGVKPGIDLGSAQSIEGSKENALVVNTFDLALEYGVGVDIFYPFFKFAPELRFSHGLLNQHTQNNSIYNNYIDKLTNHNVSLILFFE